ncbi:uncharacterized protein ColSpa_04521 [Colletotrichum spaethianum]|uniref:Uncharacterized protein n=1 Tax=Colletotrichum spaethianum TaxID=700344 RepID=A0AA37LD07_9PEZI|nr:uncharacterized protein ColSpa_04521 [Colletotrichum spaethianum]GKT44340.1 hypothetical protein ColSpa_04521 [Colletotrichum spaethianum]
MPTEDEQKAFLDTISASQEESDNDYIKPHLMHWTSDKEGSVEKDLSRLYEKCKAGKEHSAASFYIFAGRKSVEESGTTLVDRDWCTLCISEKASKQLGKLSEDNNVKIPGDD